MQIVMRNQGARLEALLQKEGQGDIMRVYEEQIGKGESQCKQLIGEIRRLAKVQALEIQQDNNGNVQQTVLNERIIKNLKTSVTNLGKLMEKQSEELEGIRKRERLYELQKRCLEESNRKVNLYSAKITLLNEKLQ